MKRRHARRLNKLGAALVVSTLAFATPCIVRAQNATPTEVARSHFARGVELFKESDFRAALIEFQRAYDAAPNYRVLYNLGQTNLELQDYAGALKAFRGYLDQGGNEVPAQRRTQVEADLHRLETRVARVDVSVNMDGADILVDDVPVAKSPAHDPIVVSEGRRKITVSKAGVAPVTRLLDVAGGDRPKISLELTDTHVESNTALAPPTTNPLQNTPITEPPPPGPAHIGPSTAFWVGLTITGAFAAGTGVLGALALMSKSDFDAKVAQLDVTTKQVDDARAKTRSFALATDITGGVAIAAAVTTVILAFTTSGKKERTTAHAHAFVIAGPGSLGVAGEL